MDHNSPEYRAHLRECITCRVPDRYGSSQYRPHTGDGSCWCVPGTILKRCRIDRDVWTDLPELEYI